ncbi:PHP domain-containing protein [Angelakisella massiliensis]|uniref:PHP domain-containing protein n=1 Tax=Angelakisella massiliensis TaxID=1871018 RepID=UPI0008F96554|nr:PHP domain-containing protein [Angelakisella massiliensis]
MEKVFYDLHIHSCLSPCGDDLMTPPNIANMAWLKGLQLIAVTDHNSCRNARAVAEAAKELPLTVIPGIELTTAEEIHVVCLFPGFDEGEAAGAYAESLLPPVPNREEIFGRQEIRDQEENLLGTIDRLLINATSLSVDDVPAFAAHYGGFAFPAHIDKSANSILSAFGCIPEHLPFTTVEVARPEHFFSLPENKHYQSRFHIVTDSDAHQLELISEAEHFLSLPGTDFSALRSFLTAAK